MEKWFLLCSVLYTREANEGWCTSGMSEFFQSLYLQSMYSFHIVLLSIVWYNWHMFLKSLSLQVLLSPVQEQEVHAFLGFDLLPFWPGILPVAVAQSMPLFSKAVNVSFLSGIHHQFWAFQNTAVFSLLSFFTYTYLENWIYISVQGKMSEQPAEC